MNIKKQVSNGNVNYTLQGKFTFADHANFRNVIDCVKENDVSTLTLDLEKLEFVDSAALGMLLVAREEAQKHDVSITLVSPSGHVKKMFELSNFDSLFTIK
mgnify:CR=1 FL=1